MEKRKSEALKPEVLIVDDDPRNVFALSAVLKARNFTCIAANSAEEALHSMNEKLPRVLLLDMMMPDMDGYEALRLLRSKDRYKNLPIIAVTAQAMTGDKEKCLDAGANDYISKPVDIDALLLLMQRHL